MEYGHHLGVYGQYTCDMIMIYLQYYRIKLSILEIYGHILDIYGQYYRCTTIIN